MPPERLCATQRTPGLCPEQEAGPLSRGVLWARPGAGGAGQLEQVRSAVAGIDAVPNGIIRKALAHGRAEQL